MVIRLSTMPRRLSNVPAAPVATALSFAAFVALGFYSAVNNDDSAAILSFGCLALTLGSASWCIVVFARRRSSNRLAAATATFLSFAAFIGFGCYAFFEDSIQAAFWSLTCLALALGSATYCIVAVVLHRRRRTEPRGFAVLTGDKGSQDILDEEHVQKM